VAGPQNNIRKLAANHIKTTDPAKLVGCRRGSVSSAAACGASTTRLPLEDLKMPESQTLARAHRDAEEGKSASTQAGEFVREEIEHIRQGKHGARSTKQAIAIGLSKARRAGVKLSPANSKKTSAATRRKAKQDLASAGKRKNVSRRRSRATSAALEREHKRAASRRSLSRQGRAAAKNRSSKDRSKAARKAARTRNRR
jgi:hypothetical protein